MKSPIKTAIPIEPYLKKFVLFVMDVQEPIEVDEKGLLGRCIMKALQETRTHKFDRVLENYTERIQVILNSDMRERSPRPHRMIYMNVELEKAFKEALIVWIKAQKRAGEPASTAAKNFLQELKIDDAEYSYDAAYKVWQRHNVKTKKVLKQQ
jgi:hypothetical protein